MSKARRLKKMRKKAQKRPDFFERLHGALLEALAWAKGEIALRTTVVTPTSRTVTICKIGEESQK